jgi:hypothetical protein
MRADDDDWYLDWPAYLGIGTTYNMHYEHTKAELAEMKRCEPIGFVHFPMERELPLPKPKPKVKPKKKRRY